MFEGRKANKCKRYNLPHILNGGVQCWCVLQRHSLSVRVTTCHYSHNTATRSLYLFPRKRSLLPTLQSKHKTFSCVIVSHSPKYCSVLSPWQINHEKTASVCFLITSSYPHKHSETLQTVSEKGQNLTSTSNWNVPTEILSGYQLRCMCQAWHTDQMLHQRNIQWLYPRAGEAVKNLEM